MQSDTLIVHQYTFSPFGQKVRSMLGYADLSWQAVEVPPQPPRPSLDPMITGYRKSPVAQIGADVFCDTRTIAAEIARLSGKPELSANDRSQADLEYLDHIEGPIFAACLGALPKGQMLWKLVTTLGFGLPKFLKDRAALGAGGGLDVLAAAEARRIWNNHLDELNGKVSDGFLGGSNPDILDFSAYHVVWFYEFMTDTQVTAARPALARWRDQMAAFGNGRSESITADQALDIARDNDPRALPAQTEDSNIGETICIAPTDYGRDDTQGVLVGATADRWVIQRETERCGLIHVHFPTRGYALTSS
ncbi:MAG: glutathione S-transferase [Hyphomicrobiaceae bacterium]|jgi:glutathione S-transferase